MARQRIRPQARLIPNMNIGDKAASEPTTRDEQEAYAQMAVLSNVPVNNAQIGQFLRNISNATLTSSVQTLSNLVTGNL